MDQTQVSNKENIEKIVETLTVTLYTHSYPISRKEAREVVGLNVLEPPKKVEELMWALYKQYELHLKLAQPFNPALMIHSGQPSATFSEETGVIESQSIKNSFIQEGEILPPPTLQQIMQILQALPSQLLAQLLPQLIQFTLMLALNPPTVKFTSQQWK
jgi:hypothetical protein